MKKNVQMLGLAVEKYLSYFSRRESDYKTRARWKFDIYFEKVE